MSYLIYKLEDLTKAIHKLAKWDKPKALPMRKFGAGPDDFTWEDWKEQAQKKCPVKYFLLETVPSWIHYKLYSLDMRWYEFTSRTFKKQHFLDLRQPVGSPYEYRWGYRDPAERMLFACFNTLCEYVEDGRQGREKFSKWIEELKSLKDAPTGQIESECKAFELYIWWRDEMPKLHAKLDEMRRKHSDPDYEDKLRESWDFEQEIERITTEKLKELMDIRGGLWT